MLSSRCDVCECHVLLLEEVRIGERTTCPSLGSPDGVAPDSEARHVSSGGGAKRNKSIYDELSSLGFPKQRVFSIMARLSAFCVSSSVSEVLGFSASNTCAMKVIASWTSSPFSQFTLRDSSCVLGVLGFLLPPTPFVGYRFFFGVESRFGMGGKIHGQAEREGSSANALHLEWRVRSTCGRRGLSTEKSTDNAIYFTKEQFKAGLRLPLPSLFKEFLHVTQISPAYVHPNMVRVLMGCSILSMLFNLDLSLLEVLFVYSIKKGKNDIYNFVASLPSLQLVTSLPNSTKGAAKGHVLAPGMTKLFLILRGCELGEGPATRRSCPARDLKSSISGRLQDRFLETIEVSYSSAQENHPEGSETEMAEDNPIDQVLVPDEGSPEEIQPTVNDGGPESGEESHPNASSGESPIDDATCTSASPFSYCRVGRDVEMDSIQLRCCCAFSENV
ncbi:hypothetical protein CK203_041526 [Vitis vinifera]|uniref:Uncharacterized protein n=1 Tax=Vitis vinifera TaxID=29760 RepID=A0A438HNF8_VITVI|nr:hypothetical protein CK203_041526 [Vitis vinifera]